MFRADLRDGRHFAVVTLTPTSATPSAPAVTGFFVGITRFRSPIRRGHQLGNQIGVRRGFNRFIGTRLDRCRVRGRFAVGVIACLGGPIGHCAGLLARVLPTRLVLAPTPPTPTAPLAATIRFLGRFRLTGRTGGFRRAIFRVVLGLLLVRQHDVVVFLGFRLDRRRHARRRQRSGSVRGDRAVWVDRGLRARPLDPIQRRYLRVVGGDDDAHCIARLDLTQAIAFVVQQIQRDGRRQMHDDFRRATLRALVLDAAQHMDCRIFGAAHMPGAAAMRAGDEAGFGQRRAQALAAHFQQAEMADLPDLDARAIVLQRILHAPFHHRVMALGLHVDEVDDDQPGQIA